MRSCLRGIAPAVSLILLAMAGGCAQQSAPEAKAVPAAFWPPYPDAPRVQYLLSIENSNNVAPPKSQFDQLIYGKEPEEILSVKKPYGVKVWKSRIYVADERNYGVTIFDLRKHQTLVLGKGDADRMQTPNDVAIADDGYKYVSDKAKGTIFVYDGNDHFVTTFVQKDLQPASVAVYQDELYVCDMKKDRQRVVVMDRRSGQIKRTIGGPGMERGQFIIPIGIAVDTKGFLYVTDMMKCKCQKFDRTGKVLMEFGTNTANVGGLVRPKQVAVDKDGIIYIVDAAFDNVQMFDQNGRLLTFFGSAGPHLGAMNLPVGVTVTDEDLDLFQEFVHPAFQMKRLVIVTNQFGPSKVAVYALGTLKEGKTVADIKNTKGTVPSGTMEDGKNKLIGVPTTLPAESSEGPFGVTAPATSPATTPTPLPK